MNSNERVLTALKGEQPDRLMCFLRDDHLAYAGWLESEGLLCPNDENDYIGSGSMGYTSDFQSGAGATTGFDVSGVRSTHRKLCCSQRTSTSTRRSSAVLSALR
jgi:hypothetical protein